MISNEVRQSLQLVCSALNKNNVEYLVVGGTAVAFYGYQRISGIFLPDKPEIKIDLDFWYNPTIENFLHLLNALADLEIEVSDLREIIFDPHKTYLKIPHSSFHIDFLPQMKGLSSFKDCKAKSTRVELDGNDFYVISKEDLRINKSAVSRDSDKKDLDSLR
jgi:predicted nucleotidyltransferase